MAEIVYILCATTSMVCAALMWRGYKRSGYNLLLWTAVCFIGFAVNNAILFVDMAMVPNHDLSTWRMMPALLGVSALLYGLVRKQRVP